MNSVRILEHVPFYSLRPDTHPHRYQIFHNFPIPGLYPIIKVNVRRPKLLSTAAAVADHLSLTISLPLPSGNAPPEPQTV